MKLLIVSIVLMVFLSHSAMAQDVVSVCLPSSSKFGGTNCNPVTSTNPFPISGSSAPINGSSNYAAATIGASSTSVLASATVRYFLSITNQSAVNNVACNLGGTAVINGAGSIDIPPGWQLVWEGTYVPLDAVNCIASGSSTPITVGAR